MAAWSRAKKRPPWGGGLIQFGSGATRTTRDDADRIGGRRIHRRPGGDVLGHEAAIDQNGRLDALPAPQAEIRRTPASPSWMD